MTCAKSFVAAFWLIGLTACGNSSPSSDVSDGGETVNAEVPAMAINEASPKQGIAAESIATGSDNDVILNSETDAVLENRASHSADYKSITLLAYECGDNCYIHYFPNHETGRDEFAICQADVCEGWNKLGLLPETLENIEVEAKFGVTNQVDGSGDVMSHNYPAITDIKLPEPDATPVK